MPELYDQDAELLRDVDALLNASQKPDSREINWDDYNFNFDSEFPAEPETRRRVVQSAEPQQFSVDEMRRLHDGGAFRAAGAFEAPAPEDLPRRQRDPHPRQARPSSGAVREAEPEETAAAPKRKHGVLKLLLALLLVLLLALGIFSLVMVLIAKMPQSDRPIGARKPGCATVLLAGTDDSGQRTDTLMLLFVDRGEKQLRLLSIPRDTMVNRTNPVPKINGAYYANGAGEQGMDFLMGYAADLIGYRPDGYMLIDLDCFVELVDLMGGVRYEVPMDMYYEDPSQDLHIDLKAGEQRLDGEAAMGLVRFRSGYAMADLERVSVQRSFLSAAMDQWTKPWKLIRAPFALRLVLKNTQTDLSTGNLSWLAQSVLLCGTGDLRADTLPGQPENRSSGSYYVEDVWAAAELINAAYNPYETEITAYDLHPYGR